MLLEKSEILAFIRQRIVKDEVSRRKPQKSEIRFDL